MASTACRNGIVQKRNSKSSSFKSRPHPSPSLGSAVRRSISASSVRNDGVPGRVRMTVRLRPQNVEETVAYADFADCVELQTELKRLKLRKNNWNSDTYEFDEVFIESALQKHVYEVVTKPVVEGFQISDELLSGCPWIPFQKIANGSGRSYGEAEARGGGESGSSGDQFRYQEDGGEGC